MHKFWNIVKNAETGERTMYMDGAIAEESWWGEAESAPCSITPAAFKAELFAEQSDITIWLNSPGGDCVAASQIYTMLKDYKGNVTIKIDGIAASAASVIAMAGTQTLMSPTAMIMIHNPLTIAIGDSEEMQKAIDRLSEFKESIINSYEIKTGLPRLKISRLMDAETWLNANKAVELGFADGILSDDKRQETSDIVNYTFSRKAVTNSLLNKVCPKANNPNTAETTGISAADLQSRLNLISH